MENRLMELEKVDLKKESQNMNVHIIDVVDRNQQELNQVLIRLTGKQSVGRLYPLIRKVIEMNRSNDEMKIEDSVETFDYKNSHISLISIETKEFRTTISTSMTIPSESLPTVVHLSYVWETFCEQTWKSHHEKSYILNRLHNSNIIENKSNFAFLQLRAKEIVETKVFSKELKPRYLDTFVALTSMNVKIWCERRWLDSSSSNSSSSDDNSDSNNSMNDHRDWWVVKAGKGNGGRDIWIITPFNFKNVINEIVSRRDEEYVIQRYVQRPKLWNGKKFHYRCYSLLMADMTTYLYSNAFILTAGLDYYITDELNKTNESNEMNESKRENLVFNLNPNPNRHITNLSINKRFTGHPGQVPINLFVDCPKVFQRISEVWSNLVEAAAGFMVFQKSKYHFEFFGIDVIVDEFDQCWLIEANRLPGLESSKNNTVVEDHMYNNMMMSLLHMTMIPLFSKDSSSEADVGLWKKIKDYSVNSSFTEYGEGSPTWKNLFAWKSYTRKHRNYVLATSSKTSS